MAPARQQPPQYNKDEKVLCFHMDMLYEAKVMDVQAGDKPSDGYRYKVHYKGWKNTWDDWVLADRIRPLDQEHKELAAQLHAQLKHNLQKNAKQPKKPLKPGTSESARGSEERGSSAVQGGARGGRRGKDWELEQVGCRLLSCLHVLDLFQASFFFVSRCQWPSGLISNHTPYCLVVFAPRMTGNSSI
jgi:mortality factor 4-like protein 1